MTNASPDARDQSKDIARVFALQQAHQWDVKASSSEQRKAKLAKLKAAVEAHADDIIAAVREDTRKPVGEIRVTEVLNVTANIQRNIDNLDQWMTPTGITPSMNPNDRAQIVYEARGVCLILGPWNFPLGLTFGPLAAAVAAGNCCMVKLTDLCPATAAIAGVIIREVFEENEVALFEGEVAVATTLLELPFSHIFFTGSTRVGKLVMAAAAKHLATVTLELGGKLEGGDLTVHPTMLTDVTPQMKILQEEIFAPVLPVMTYDTLDQVIGYIEARDKPLALYVYSPDPANVQKVLDRTSSGGVTVNGVFSHYLENQLPFGGVNQSGMGSYHGYFGFKAFSHERAVYRHQ